MKRIDNYLIVSNLWFDLGGWFSISVSIGIGKPSWNIKFSMCEHVCHIRILITKSCGFLGKYIFYIKLQATLIKGAMNHYALPLLLLWLQPPPNPLHFAYNHKPLSPTSPLCIFFRYATSLPYIASHTRSEECPKTCHTESFPFFINFIRISKRNLLHIYT